MFSGIVTSIGRITQLTPRLAGFRLTVEAGGLNLADVAIGDSIAHNGVCLTVVTRQGNGYTVDVSRETLDCTVGLDGQANRGEVNLEKALRLADRLGGHLVQGHVDAVGTIVSPAPDLRVQVDPALLRYVVHKGSITVDGTSLTVAAVHPDGFSIAVIPHTAEVTTLGRKGPGDPVNLELDVVAKYVESLLEGHRP